MNPDLNNLKLTEIMDTGSSAGNFEFLEFKNIGNNSLNVTGVALVSGPYFIFPALILRSNQFIVLASNAAQFQQKYRMAASYQYSVFFLLSPLIELQSEPNVKGKIEGRGRKTDD